MDSRVAPVIEKACNGQCTLLPGCSVEKRVVDGVAFTASNMPLEHLYATADTTGLLTDANTPKTIPEPTSTTIDNASTC